MNFKTKSFIVLLIISVFLLSSCEVYQTLYGTGPQKEMKKENEYTKVIRVEGETAKSPETLGKTVYSSAVAVQHDPFKAGQNPLGPFDKGKSLGFALGQWLDASGIGIYSVKDAENAMLDLSFKKLIPNGVYTLWCSRVTFPPEPKMVDIPCGKEDGSDNIFNADDKGNGYFSVGLKPLEASTKENAALIALAYHSDGKTYGASPGDFGANSHVQLFFLVPLMTENKTVLEAPIKFTNHINAGFPEQDVFIEYEEPVQAMNETKTTGEVVMENKSSDTEKTHTEQSAENDNGIKPKVITHSSEEQTGEKAKEKPIVVVVQETDLVSLVPKAEDPDKNTNLAFTFTSPLSEKGEWQTNYGDSGQYTVTVTASDSESTTSREVLIIVNKKEEPPKIDAAKPIESGLAIDEMQSIDFNVDASDLNKDPLTYNWKLDGKETGTESKYTYQTTYDNAGTHTVKADVSDGLSSVSKIWSVDVKNVNRKPVLQKISDIKAKETDKIVITALATDDDQDPINYSISDSRFKQEGNVFTWQTDYDSAGTYQVTATAADWKDKSEQTFSVSVENVNRPPVITDIVQKS